MKKNISLIVLLALITGLAMVFLSTVTARPNPVLWHKLEKVIVHESGYSPQGHGLLLWGAFCLRGDPYLRIFV
ncbi:MAG: hypothetical protein K6U80_04890 [Firmicutes bacterium]|nr:hypothetical protein [Bacillota bacterium]